MVSEKPAGGETSMGTKRTLVFVCVHGSAKSLIAAEHFRRLAEQRGVEIDVTWAGTDPDLEIPAHVIRGLLEDGIDVRGRRPRQATEEELADAWRVVSFGCDLSEVTPSKVERWDDIPDVSEDYKAVRDRILASLPRLLAECERARDSRAA
jgi:protein-tyrosine-phosphatase